MRQYTCTCGQPLFFDNQACEKCGLPVGFDPQTLTMRPLAEKDRVCANRTQYALCNWIVVGGENKLCQSCALTQTIPDLAHDDNLQRLQRLEAAKRRLVYSLLIFGLPVVSRVQDEANGLAFVFKEDQQSNPAVVDTQVLTGHADGIITINIAEADPVERTLARERMNEQYRTLLGHMRHESGHFYWDTLLRDSDKLAQFRELFGDERADYAQALQSHYANGPAANWQDSFISAYAGTHPWEDWAESWAHFFHMTETLETAHAYHIIEGNPQVSPVDFDIDDAIDGWMQLSVIMNELNRSMGVQDSYPFVLSAPAVDKLRFVHDVIKGASEAYKQ